MTDESSICWLDRKIKKSQNGRFEGPIPNPPVTIHQKDALRLKERLSAIPFHAERAKKRGDAYWLRLARGVIDPDNRKPQARNHIDTQQ